VDRILKGAKLGDAPIERPPKFELVVILKTAAALGLRFPHSLLLQVDEVITLTTGAKPVRPVVLPSRVFHSGEHLESGRSRGPASGR